MVSLNHVYRDRRYGGCNPLLFFVGDDTAKYIVLFSPPEEDRIHGHTYIFIFSELHLKISMTRCDSHSQAVKYLALILDKTVS